MPHAMAAVAVRRSGGQDAFARDTLEDPAIARLRHAVRLKPYVPIEAWPNDRPGRVTWRLTDGATLTEFVESARGGLDKPFAKSELLDKIDALTRDAFPGMATVLRRLVDDPERAARSPWRDLVADMIAQ
jgi:hypothetical protein